MIEAKKIMFFNEYEKSLGLTYEEIVREQSKMNNKPSNIGLRWEYLKAYLFENFGLDLNVLAFRKKEFNRSTITKR